MPHIPGHYRNGRWVRPHYRRNTPRAVQSTGQVRVSAHHRTDGTYVRSHYRSVDPVPTSPTSTGSDLSWLWHVLIALLVLGALGVID